MHEVSTETRHFTKHADSISLWRGLPRQSAGLIWSLLLVTIPAAASDQDLDQLRTQAGEWLKQAAENSYPGTQARIEMGPIDGRLKFSQCQSLAFALPSGGHAWGRGSVEARCNVPRSWRVYLGYQIRLAGPALFTRHAVATRQSVLPKDLELSRIDYARAPESYLRELPAETLAARPLAAGQPLTLDSLILPQIVQAGREVQILASGHGFSLSQRGTALASGSAGQIIKVKITSGRIVQGVIRGEGLIEIKP